METIEQLLNKGRMMLSSKDNELSKDCCERMTSVRNSYGNRENFLISFNPSRQHDICTCAERCYTADVPTLSMLRTAYSDSAPVAWLVAQLTDLSAYCGVKDKMTDRQLTECAMMIVDNYHWLKVSELMLFFYRFKLWKYGSFYGVVDPSRIMEALTVFVRERNDALSKIEQETRDRKMEEHTSKAVTYEEYLRLKNERTGNTTD